MSRQHPPKHALKTDARIADLPELFALYVAGSRKRDSLLEDAAAMFDAGRKKSAARLLARARRLETNLRALEMACGIKLDTQGSEQ